jgi:membrane associated rhomboid family serine protease
MPVSDRDYMRREQKPARKYRGPGKYDWFTQNPVLVLIVLNLVFFLATSISDGIIFNLGMVPALFLERPWTILTSMFVHSGFGHIFGNMITLFFFGKVLFQIVGQNKFLAVYFIGGLVGNALFLLLGYWNILGTSSLSLVIGASGAVYAVAGALVVLMPNIRVNMWFVVPMPLWVVVLIFFVLWSFIPGVAWQAHMGGLAVGLIAGYIFKKNGRYYYYR